MSLSEQIKQNLNQIFCDFKINAEIESYKIGSRITTYETKLNGTTRINKVISLLDDIALRLGKGKINITPPTMGKNTIGIQVENETIKTVFLNNILNSGQFNNDSNYKFVLGEDSEGNNIIVDVKDLPNLLIAGSTNSGKSVCLNAIITSLISNSSPTDLQMFLIDPKQVEFNIYNELPHLVVPVITDVNKVPKILQCVIREMNRRYTWMSNARVRNIDEFNEVQPNKLPKIVIIIDEFADMMMSNSSRSVTEDIICRLAQMGRAAGVYLIIATQRPTVNIITGKIKANMPSRIAFALTSKIDSRTILDRNGAETLLGRGDLLFSLAGNEPIRVQGAYISTSQVQNIVEKIIQKYSN